MYTDLPGPRGHVGQTLRGRTLEGLEGGSAAGVVKDLETGARRRGGGRRDAQVPQPAGGQLQAITVDVAGQARDLTLDAVG